MNNPPLPIPIVLVFDALAGCTQHCATLISGATNVVPKSRDSMDLSRSWIFTKGQMNSRTSALLEFRIFLPNPCSLCGVGPHRPSTVSRSGNLLPSRVSGYLLNFVHTGQRGLCPGEFGSARMAGVSMQ